MIIGFDGKRAVNNMTGLGNYSRLVLERLAEEYPADKLYVYTPDLRRNPRLTTLRGFHNVEFRLPPLQGFHGSLWRTFGVTNNLKADGVDIFHGLSNELPLNIQKAGIPSVVTIHDVIYRTLPECYKGIDRMLYDFKYGRSCRNADRIIAVSQRTKDDVVRFYGIDPDRIDVIYQGCDESFRNLWDKDRLEELRKRLGLPEKYILQVGTIEKRKNLELTIRALNTLPADISLVAVGRDHHGYKPQMLRLAQELGVSDRIVWLEGLDFRDLPGVNQAAEVVLYPSRYEGFGIPVLEGLESNTPVIAATGSCLEEAGGEKTLYVNPDSPRELSEAIGSILSGAVNRDEMIRAGREYARRFDKRDMASRIMDCYRRTIEDFNRFRAEV